MLILSRKPNQSIILQQGDVQIVVKITSIEKLSEGEFRANIGFDAPTSVRIDREEVFYKRNNRLKELFNDK